jgi:hypothetical protein
MKKNRKIKITAIKYSWKTAVKYINSLFFVLNITEIASKLLPCKPFHLFVIRGADIDDFINNNKIK